MKHLRGINDTFKEIRFEEYSKLFNESMYRSIDTYSLKHIRKLLPHHNIVQYEYRLSISYGDRTFPEVSIWQLPDEWFMVKVKNGFTITHTYFKCDQIEGLIDCLKGIYNL